MTSNSVYSFFVSHESVQSIVISVHDDDATPEVELMGVVVGDRLFFQEEEQDELDAELASDITALRDYVARYPLFYVSVFGVGLTYLKREDVLTIKSTTNRRLAANDR